MQINSNADKIEDISKLYEGKKRKVTISSIVNGLSSVKDKQSEKIKKNEKNIKGIINHLNKGNKLPSPLYK